ncbi:MAG: hypothetical protein J6Y33_04255 [Prevotella sp.]|nr:hypothetical protein [Prevotella sp.]
MNKNAEIPNYKGVFDLLLLPEWLNGKELNYLSFVEDKDRETATLMETARQFQYLYDAICAGRFNLATACKRNYTLDFLEENSSEKAHIWVQIQFVNNAIFWYNATFDILLQSIWFYYKLYTYLTEPLVLTSKSCVQIQKACNREEALLLGEGRVPQNLMNDIKKLRNGMTNNIPTWANFLKHNGSILYKEYSHRNTVIGSIECKKGEDVFSAFMRGAPMLYNSSKTLKELTIREVINTLIHYHQSLIEVSKALVETIDL